MRKPSVLRSTIAYNCILQSASTKQFQFLAPIILRLKATTTSKQRGTVTVAKTVRSWELRTTVLLVDISCYTVGRINFKTTVSNSRRDGKTRTLHCRRSSGSRFWLCCEATLLAVYLKEESLVHSDYNGCLGCYQPSKPRGIPSEPSTIWFLLEENNAIFSQSHKLWYLFCGREVRFDSNFCSTTVFDLFL
jgi:hypothetical protein